MQTLLLRWMVPPQRYLPLASDQFFSRFIHDFNKSSFIVLRLSQKFCSENMCFALHLISSSFYCPSISPSHSQSSVQFPFSLGLFISFLVCHLIKWCSSFIISLTLCACVSGECAFVSTTIYRISRAHWNCKWTFLLHNIKWWMPQVNYRCKCS